MRSSVRSSPQQLASQLSDVTEDGRSLPRCTLRHAIEPKRNVARVTGGHRALSQRTPFTRLLEAMLEESCICDVAFVNSDM